jgi:competence protein ComEA
MNIKLRDLFTFTRGERVAAIFLIACILLVLMIRWIPGFFPARSVSRAGDDKELRDFLVALLPADTIMEDGKGKVLQAYDTLELFLFDPNRVTKIQLLHLGFTERQAQTLIHYRMAGGKFLRKEDLRKIYGLYDEQYQLLEDYVQIAEAEGVSDTARIKNTSPGSLHQLLEINSCDSAGLLSLPAIGPVFAGRIVKYRNLLGGFTEVIQLLEVYGMEPERLDIISPFLRIDTMNIRRININSCTFSELLRHPYLDYYQTKAIMEYRKLAGSFQDCQDLVRNRLITGETYRKLRPYLTTE